MEVPCSRTEDQGVPPGVADSPRFMVRVGVSVVGGSLCLFVQ